MEVKVSLFCVLLLGSAELALFPFSANSALRQEQLANMDKRETGKHRIGGFLRLYFIHLVRNLSRLGRVVPRYVAN
jgi:hypothetical protein